MRRGGACCSARAVKERNDLYMVLLDMCKLPTLRDMAIRDARSVVSQMALIEPNWFRRRQLGKGATVPLSQSELSMVGHYELPKYINKGRDDLEMKLQELAHEKLRTEKKETKKVICYTEIWKKSLEACSEVKDRNMDFECRIFSEYVRFEIGCLNQNHRRSHYLTPTKPLKRHAICNVRPSEKMGQEPGPERPTLEALLSGLEVCMIRDKCLVCGERVIKGGWVEASIPMHETRWATDRPIWIRCREDGCYFGAHEKCVNSLRVLAGEVKLGQRKSCEYRCNEVYCQISYKELDELARKHEHELKGSNVSNNAAEIKRKIVAAKTRFNLKQKKRKHAEMRFYNDMSECNHCGMYYDLTMSEHLMNDCPYGPRTTPSRLVNPRRRARREVNDAVMSRLIFFETHLPP